MAKRKRPRRTLAVTSTLVVGVFLLTNFGPADMVWPVLAPLIGGALFEYLRSL